MWVVRILLECFLVVRISMWNSHFLTTQLIHYMGISFSQAYKPISKSFGFCALGKQSFFGRMRKWTQKRHRKQQIQIQSSLLSLSKLGYLIPLSIHEFVLLSIFAHKWHTSWDLSDDSDDRYNNINNLLCHIRFCVTSTKYMNSAVHNQIKGKTGQCLILHLWHSSKY